MEGDCNVYAHSSLWMRPTGEWSINAKMVYTAKHTWYTESEHSWYIFVCGQLLLLVIIMPKYFILD